MNKIFNEKKCVLVIPNGKWQKDLISRLLMESFFVVTIGINNIYTKTTKDYVVDSYNSITLELVKSVFSNFNIIAVITDQDDYAVKLVSNLSEHLRLPGISATSSALFTDKSKMRLFQSVHGYDFPRFRLLENIEMFHDYSDELRFPLVLKPLDGKGSNGVFKLQSFIELTNKYQVAINSSQYASVLIEEFIEGTEFTVEGFKFDNKHVSLAISKKTHYPDHPTIAKSLKFDYFFNQSMSEFLVMHNEMIMLSGLEFGITHSEYIYSNNKYYLVEFAARGGGTNISSRIVPAISGIRPQVLLINKLLNCNLDYSNNAISKIVLLEFLRFDENRIVKGIIGCEQILEYDFVIDFSLSLTVGIIVPSLSSDSSRHGYFIITGNDDHDIEFKKNLVIRSLKVTYW
jgi:hypothetical protein